VFSKFKEFGSALQVLRYCKQQELLLPIHAAANFVRFFDAWIKESTRCFSVW
jgi:hypothetical protein